MLSRTADHLLWMARYMERAENTARMMDVHWQTDMLPHSAAQTRQGWAGLLSICELLRPYQRRHGGIEAGRVIEFMASDADNPSSIVACLHASRENARAVRGTLPIEVWETHNQIWLEARRLLADGLLQHDPGRFFEWVKTQSHLARGVIQGTMQMDQSRYFMRLGTFLERADNTARLLDVKFHSHPQVAWQVQGGAHEERDFYHWSAVLRSVSAYEAYRRVYRDVVSAERVVALLTLRADMPRSMLACMNEVVDILDRLGASKECSLSRRAAGRLQADLQYAELGEILSDGLHPYLTRFLERVTALGVTIGREFLGSRG